MRKSKKKPQFFWGLSRNIKFYYARGGFTVVPGATGAGAGAGAGATGAGAGAGATGAEATGAEATPILREFIGSVPLGIVVGI